MRIDRVSLHRVRVPLLEPFRISNGVVVEKDAIVVEVQGERITGWGEASPMPGSFYSTETPESTWQALVDELVPAVVKRGTATLREFAEQIEKYPREPFARAGLENALCDLEARRQGRPLWAMLEGSNRAVPSGVAIGLCDSIDALLERIRKYSTQGYKRVKIKITHDADVEVLERIRAAFPDLPLMVDANATYTAADLPLIRELERFGLLMIEQPFAPESLELAAEAQRSMKTPLCADESAESPEAVQQIIRLGAAKIINIKIQRVGGLTCARRMHDLALANGLRCWVGTMPELGIASAHGLHLATLQNFTYPTDIEASSRWYPADIISPPIELQPDGTIRLPQGAGIGYRPEFQQYVQETREFGS